MKPEFGRWPRYEADEIEAVAEVLRSGRVNRWTGARCETFEQAFAAFCGAPFALTVTNGTAALELALIALGIGSGDEVITSPRSFFASASSIAVRGARPVFADVDPASQSVTADTIAPHITERTRAILVVHLGGWPADMDPILSLAQEHGLAVIEDCAQAHGARYKGRVLGSIGDFGCFSFCTDKIISTGGEGGLLLCRNSDHHERAWSWRDHGRDRFLATSPPPDEPGFRWLHRQFGTNLRMTEMQAAIGLAQLQKLPHWLYKRHQNASALREALRDVPGLHMPWPDAQLQSAWYKAYLFVDDPAIRPQFLRRLRANGIPPHVGACPAIFREAAFAGQAPVSHCPTAADIGDRSVMLPVDHTLDTSDMELIATAVRDAISHC